LLADHTETLALFAGNGKLSGSFVLSVIEEDELARWYTEQELAAGRATGGGADYLTEALDERERHFGLALGAVGVERFIHLV